jgi:hypothetical protein
MAKVDIEAAYRHVPIDPYDWDKTTFCWPTDSWDNLYFDGYLQFCLKSACEVFNRIGRAIIRMMTRRGPHVLVVYVDDFIIICSTEAMAWYVFWALHILLRKPGFTVNICERMNVLLHVKSLIFLRNIGFGGHASSFESRQASRTFRCDFGHASTSKY